MIADMPYFKSLFNPDIKAIIKPVIETTIKNQHGGKRRGAGRPRIKDRCECGLLTKHRALSRGHVCATQIQDSNRVMQDFDFGA